MIILSGVLVVLAFALLVTGIVMGNTGHEVLGLDGLKMIYVSIGVSIVSALFLAVGVVLRRRELFGTVPATAAKKPAKATKAVRPAKTKARVGAGDDVPVPAASATATDVPAETAVFVVPGRKRYHLETCRQLTGREKEELTFEEAREEGFTACTACLPDTALAARAALTDLEAAEEQADDTAMPSTEIIADRPSAGRDTASTTAPAESFAEVTRTDLPAQTPESVADEPAAERPASRAASLFEPVKRTRPADDQRTAYQAAEAQSEETAESADAEDAATAASRPWDDTPAETSESAAEPDADAAPAYDDEPAGGADTSDSEAEDDRSTADAAAEPDEAPQDDEAADHAETVESAAPTASDVGERADDTADDSSEADADDAVGTGGGARSGSTATVRILSGTKRYHRSDCALIEDIAEDADDLEIVTLAEALERGCTPCLVCQPDKDADD